MVSLEYHDMSVSRNDYRVYRNFKTKKFTSKPNTAIKVKL